MKNIAFEFGSYHLSRVLFFGIFTHKHEDQTETVAKMLSQPRKKPILWAIFNDGANSGIQKSFKIRLF